MKRIELIRQRDRLQKRSQGVPVSPTRAERAEIRERLESGESAGSIAFEYGLSIGQVRRCVRSRYFGSFLWDGRMHRALEVSL